jgi:GNAT superfamily N-acetyltransferase
VRSEVRLARSDEAAAIATAYLASWRAGYADLLPAHVVDEQASPRKEYDWLGPIQSDSMVVFVAIRNGDIVGVVQADDEPDGTDYLPELAMLYVVPSAWGTTVAKDLLGAATSWMGARGYTAGSLRVVEEQARARRFYEREGWVLDEKREPASNGFFRLIYYRKTWDVPG